MESERVRKLTQQFTRGILSEKDDHVLLTTLTTLSMVVGMLFYDVH